MIHARKRGTIYLVTETLVFDSLPIGKSAREKCVLIEFYCVR